MAAIERKKRKPHQAYPVPLRIRTRADVEVTARPTTKMGQGYVRGGTLADAMSTSRSQVNIPEHEKDWRPTPGKCYACGRKARLETTYHDKPVCQSCLTLTHKGGASMALVEEAMLLRMILEEERP